MLQKFNLSKKWFLKIQSFNSFLTQNLGKLIIEESLSISPFLFRSYAIG